MGSHYVVKVQYENNLRRLALGEADLDFSQLESRVRDLFQISRTASLLLTYTDKGGDVVTMADDRDLKDAFVLQSINPLRLSVTITGTQSNHFVQRKANMSDSGDAGDVEDRGQRNKEAADTSVSSQGGSLVTPNSQHSQAFRKEQVWVPTGAMVAEEGRKWARKGDGGWWRAISKASPWAAAVFQLTKERDEKYEGSYLSGYREDDLIQLRDILQDATYFRIFSALERDEKFEFPAAALQMFADELEQFVFLVQRLADVLQTGDEPTPVLVCLCIDGWKTPREYSTGFIDHLGSLLRLSPRMKDLKQVVEESRLRLLPAVRLIIEAAKSGKLNKAEYFVLHGVGLDDGGLQALSAVIKAGHFPCLTRLYLAANVFASKGANALLDAIKSGKLLSLEKLALEYNSFGDDDCEAFEKALSSGSLEVLRELLFHDNDIGDRGAQALARGFESGRVKKLAVLHLNSNRIGDDGMVALATSLAAGTFPGLTDLDVRYNPFGTKGIQSLAKALESGNLNSLQRLSIKNGQRSEKVAKPLVAALSVNHELTLHLSFDTNLFPTRLIRERRQLEERNRKHVGLLAKTGGNAVPASSAKVYLCGNPEVGKTNLRRSMAGSYWESPPRTRGIEISKIAFQETQDESAFSWTQDKKDISLVVWDMAGQDEYQQLHHSFLKNQGTATFFVVMCTSQNIEKAEEELKYWFRFISSSVGDQIPNQRDVYVVVNCWDGDLKFPVTSWKRMLSILSEQFEGYLNIHMNPFMIDVRLLMDVKSVTKALVERSREVLKDKMIPEICHFIQTEFMGWGEMKSSFPAVSRVEFNKKLKLAGARWSEEAIELALMYMNQVGVVIYIHEEFLKWEDTVPRRKLVVLDPTWFCGKIMGNIFLPQGMGTQTQGLFRARVDSRTGSISVASFRDYFQFLVGLWDPVEFYDILTILMWLGTCYKGWHENIYIPALIDQNGIPEDSWYTGESEKGRECQWVMGYLVERDQKKIALALDLWHKFQVRLAQTKEFNDQYEGSDFECGKYFVTFKTRWMCVLVEVNAEKECPTFDHIEVFVKPLLNSQIDDLDSNTRKQCQVDLANDVVEMLLDLWTQVCPGINFIQRAVWPWPSSQPRRPKVNLEKDVKVNDIIKWVQERGAGRILQRRVGGTFISWDQLLSTKSKKLLLEYMGRNSQLGKSRLSEVMELGIYSSDLWEGVDIDEE